MNEPSLTDQLLRILCHQLTLLLMSEEKIMEDSTSRTGFQAMVSSMEALDKEYF